MNQFNPTPTVKRYFKACRKDDVFLSVVKKIEKEHYIKPHHFSDNSLVIAYSSTYYGWLLGKGEFDKIKQIEEGTYEFNN